MRKLIACIFGLLLLTGTSFAISEMEPASVLIYPYFNSGPGYETLISVTNVNTCTVYNPLTGHDFGDVWVHFNYVDKTYCDISNQGELLTPFDTLTVLASRHNPTQDEGWLYIVAEDPNTQLLPIKFDGDLVFGGGVLRYKSGLIGDAVVVNGVANYLWSIPAIGIKACPALAFGDFTDQNLNGKLDFGPFSGEYEGLPTTLYISSFIELGVPLNSDAILVLLTFYDLDVRVDLYFEFCHNDEGTLYSQTDDFYCWMYRSFDDIWNGADQLTEYGGITTYFSPVVTGWGRVIVTGGVDEAAGGKIPAEEIPILGMMIQKILASTYQAAHLLHHSPDKTVKGQLE